MEKNKPNPGMFSHALDAMHLPATETVFVDDYEQNLDGASALGIQSVLVLSRTNSQASTRYLNIKNYPIYYCTYKRQITLIHN
ncbi:HAD-IA family hydrolase [Paenibacillus rhizoplanae]